MDPHTRYLASLFRHHHHWDNQLCDTQRDRRAKLHLRIVLVSKHSTNGHPATVDSASELTGYMSVSQWESASR